MGVKSKGAGRKAKAKQTNTVLQRREALRKSLWNVHPGVGTAGWLRCCCIWYLPSHQRSFASFCCQRMKVVWKSKCDIV